jgi:hypothetical protein
MRHNINLIGGDTFNHCASITIINNTPIIVGYCGQECTDKQRVFIYHNNEYIYLENKTGNPIIWNYEDKLNIIYSKFEDKDKNGNYPLYPVERWKYCSNHHIQLSLDNIKLKEIPKSKEIPEMFGLLARCQPIMFNNECLIPMYREKNPRCEIWSFDGNEFTNKSIFGETDHISNLGRGCAIQPTLMIENNELIALCRNVAQPPFNKAWFSKSPDGVIWSELEESNIPNMNNSLVCIGYNNTNYAVYNQDRSRSDIILRDLHKATSTQLGIGRANNLLSYSYPNYALDGENLHIVHSNSKMIAHHIFDKEFLDWVL